MRIISGKYKGKKIDGFDLIGTRPTMDRVKESVFAMIQFHIKNNVCLDLFAGSGSLGIECISNYSKKTYMVDNNDLAIRTIKNNLKNVNDEYQLLNMDYKDALLYFYNKNIKFDCILLDPPYKSDCLNTSLTLIHKYDLLNDNGVIVCEYEGNIINSKYKEIKYKKYGTKEVKIYTNFDNK